MGEFQSYKRAVITEKRNTQKFDGLHFAFSFKGKKNVECFFI